MQYLVEFGPALKALPGFGFFIRPWMTIDYPSYRGIGRFEAVRFVPEEWRPRVPNPAYVRSRPDDTFWAARKLMALSDEAVRAAVRAGHYSDPRAERFLGDALIQRRDAIGKAFLVKVNPVVDPRLSADGRLSFGNAAVQYRLRAPAIVLHGDVAAIRQRDRCGRPSRRDHRDRRTRRSAGWIAVGSRRVRADRDRRRRRCAPVLGFRGARLLQAHGRRLDARRVRSAAGRASDAPRTRRGGPGQLQVSGQSLEDVGDEILGVLAPG